MKIITNLQLLQSYLVGAGFHSYQAEAAFESTEANRTLVKKVLLTLPILLMKLHYDYLSFIS